MPNTNHAVQASYDRCSTADTFFDTFYDIFLAKSSEIAQKFTHTDFRKQKQLIKASLVMMIRLGTGEAAAQRIIERVGESHSRTKLDIQPEFYTLWLDSLCETVKQHDPDYSAALEAQWREQMQPGIALVTCRY